MADLTLDYLGQFASGALAKAQTAITTQIDSFSGGSGGSLSIPDLFKLQVGLSSFTVLTQAVSSVVKDVSDTMKSVARNIS